MIKGRILGKSVGCLGALLLAAPSANALQATFFGEDLGLGDHAGKLLLHPNSDAARASFLGSLIGVGTEDFEAQTLYATSPLALNFSGVGTATLTGNGEVMDDGFGPAFDPTPQADNEWFGRFAISGAKYYGQVISPGFSVVLDNPAAAFGFYASDIGDFAGTLTLTFEDGSTDVVNYPNTVTAGGSVGYFGYINTDEPFVKVTFGTTGGDDAFGFDDLTIGSVEQVCQDCPDTGMTVALLGFAAAGLMSVRRRLNPVS